MPGGADPAPGRFDNRWLVFPQDFPSANFFLSRAIQTLLLVQEKDQPLADLAHVLLRWQEAGIRLLLKNPLLPAPVTDLHVHRPSQFRSIWYRVMALAGLRRNSAGGFGSIVPQASSGG